MCYHGNGGPCRWPQGRSLHCLPGNGQQGAPPSPDTGLHYPRTPVSTYTPVRSGGSRGLSDHLKDRNVLMCFINNQVLKQGKEYFVSLMGHLSLT